MNSDFLLEIGTEELPLRAILPAIDALCQQFEQQFKQANLSYKQIVPFSTPRRLALRVEGLATTQPNRTVHRQGPALDKAKNANGEWTPAALGFAKSCGIDANECEIKDNRLTFTEVKAGRQTSELLVEIIQNCVKKIPIKKAMRWGAGNQSFIRPVHWVVALFQKKVIPVNLFGVSAGQVSYGHRYHAPKAINLKIPKRYQAQLEKASVMVDYETRKDTISAQLSSAAKRLGGQLIEDEDLLTDVCNIVEWPVILTGKIDEHYLELPRECLILSMKIHQKCFLIEDKYNKLLPHFVLVANIRSQNPQTVIHGNERVVEARLADAAFFYECDKKQPLIDIVDKLKQVVFQEKLGSLYDRAMRMQGILKHLTDNSDHPTAMRLAQLAKCDLLTQMVGEFPELQGFMGEVYARYQDEDEAIAVALREQYQPRFAGDELPKTRWGSLLGIADRLDLLAGIFAIDERPTGEKDPFGLRRAAIGLIRIILESDQNFDLHDLIATALTHFQHLSIADNTAEQLFQFIIERFKIVLATQYQFLPEVIESVLSQPSGDLGDMLKRVQAVDVFRKHHAAPTLASANKRVHNILRQAKNLPDSGTFDSTLFEKDAETKLADHLHQKLTQTEPLFEQHDYEAVLTSLADLKENIDTFFDEVMVMVDDERIKNNRILLLQQLQHLFSRVADISCLAALAPHD